MTADHIIAWKDSIGISSEEYAVAILDRATRWIHASPVASKSAEETIAAFNRFSGNDEIRRFYSDHAPELAAAAK